jgi:hypothetical protein
MASTPGMSAVKAGDTINGADKTLQDRRGDRRAWPATATVEPARVPAFSFRSAYLHGLANFLLVSEIRILMAS